MKPSIISQALAAGVVGLALLGCAGTPASDPPPPDESAATGVTRDFVAVTTAGDEVSGESLRGHVTIIDFFAVF